MVLCAQPHWTSRDWHWHPPRRLLPASSSGLHASRLVATVGTRELLFPRVKVSGHFRSHLHIVYQLPDLDCPIHSRLLVHNTGGYLLGPYGGRKGIFRIIPDAVPVILQGAVIRRQHNQDGVGYIKRPHV